MSKKILFVFLAVLLASITFSACGTNVNDFEYRADAAGIFIIRYVGTGKNVRIPEKINNVPVVIIGDNAFRGRQINKVRFPRSLQIIGAGAFADNNLTRVVLPASIETVFDGAFDANVEVRKR